MTNRQESPILEHLDEEIITKIHSIPVPHLFKIMELYIKMGIGSYQLYSESDKRIGEYIDTLNPRDFPTILYDFALADRALPNFAINVEKPLIANLDMYSPTELAITLWSLVSFQGRYRPETAKKILEKLENYINELDITHIAYVWDAILHLKLYDHVIFEKTKATMIEYFEQDYYKIALSDTHIANIYLLVC